jgi:dihydroorotate dehydrogenase (fumarate)
VIDLSTRYLGLALRNPLVVSASPLCEDLIYLQQMEEAGAAAVVLPSLFEEQLDIESLDLHQQLSRGTESFAEALSYFPDMADYNLGPEGYLELVRQAKSLLSIPVIASLNGTSPNGWVRFARQIEEAGADALELNIFSIPTDPGQTASGIEQGHCCLVRQVKAAVRIPVAVKIGPHFTAPVHFARELSHAGADGLVLFNRFYQPDFDLEALEVTPSLSLSTPHELLLRLHWVAILYGRVKADLAITGGIHDGRGVLKAMMAGSRVAMMTSALLKHGIGHLARVRAEVVRWMEEHEYTSVRQMQGSMSRLAAGQPAGFERANYMKVLRSYALRSPDPGRAT